MKNTEAGVGTFAFRFSEETDLPVQEDIGASIADVRVLSDAASVRSFVGSVCASGGNVGFSLNAVGAEAMTARALGLGIAAERSRLYSFPGDAGFTFGNNGGAQTIVFRF